MWFTTMWWPSWTPQTGWAAYFVLPFSRFPYPVTKIRTNFTKKSLFWKHLKQTAFLPFTIENTTIENIDEHRVTDLEGCSWSLTILRLLSRKTGDPGSRIPLLCRFEPPCSGTIIRLQSSNRIKSSYRINLVTLRRCKSLDAILKSFQLRLYFKIKKFLTCDMISYFTASCIADINQTLNIFCIMKSSV